MKPGMWVNYCGLKYWLIGFGSKPNVAYIERGDGSVAKPVHPNIIEPWKERKSGKK